MALTCGFGARAVQLSRVRRTDGAVADAVASAGQSSVASASVVAYVRSSTPTADADTGAGGLSVAMARRMDLGPQDLQTVTIRKAPTVGYGLTFATHRETYVYVCRGSVPLLRFCAGARVRARARTHSLQYRVGSHETMQLS
jgi:hypothetical protein